ncbi:MAG: hypothetical protein Q8R30_04485 [bacterium]|nr:hypothetical protein [bacterium]MDZ4285592.1 hypothetical protein [Candidatus Sungbacteria bacterium]
MFRRHWIAFVLMIVVGCIYASHHFFVPRLLPAGSVYDPLPRGEYGDETLLYGPRAHSVFQDFGIRGDFSLAEYPTSPALLPILNPLLLGGLGKIFGSFGAGVIASDFLFPSLTFLILYFLVQEVGVGIGASLLFSLIFIIAPKFGISIPPFSAAHMSALKQVLFPYLTKSDVLFFSQFDEPKLTFLFFAFSVYAIVRALKRRGRGNTILAGISFGVLFYTYLYDWATVLTSLVLMAIFFFWKKDYRRLKQIGIIAGVGILVSGYYWINLFRLANLAGHKDIVARLGGEFSHHLRFETVWKSYVRAIALVVLLWATLGRKMRETVIVLSALLLSYFITVNEQVITGFNVQPDHWYRAQFLPISLSVFLLLHWAWKRYAYDRIRKYTGLVCGVAIIYLLAAFLAGQYGYSRDRADLFVTPSAYAQGFEWIEANTKSEAVIGSFSVAANLDLQMHTSRKIFMPFGLSTVAPDDELWKRAMIMSALWGIAWDEFENRFGKGGGANYLFGDEYGDHSFDANFSTYHWQIPEDLLAQKLREYIEMLGSKRPLVVPYRLDYLFVDKKEFPSWKEPLKLLPSLKKVFENERVMIFQAHA